jgi:cytochrome oxidase Cu insertion factor (SCO1/SenC/PrrC family)
LAHRPEPTAEPEAEPEGLPAGYQAPDFALFDSDGRTHTLASLLSQGRPVVLTFMSTSCSPCKTLGPELARWQSTLTDRVTIALIAAGTPEGNAGVWEEFGMTNVLFDPDDDIADAYHVRSTPNALVVDPDGTIGSAPYGGVHGVEVIVRLAMAGATDSGSERAVAPKVIEMQPSTA